MNRRAARSDFASDNTAGICPEAWAMLEAANVDAALSYGDDQWTARACELVRETWRAFEEFNLSPPLALEALFDQLTVLQFVDRVFADRRVGLRMHEIREGIEHLVGSATLLELFLDDLKVAQAGDARTGHNHGLGAAGDERLHAVLEDSEHDLGLVLDQAIVRECDVLERFSNDALGIELFLLVGLGLGFVAAAALLYAVEL